MSGSYGDGHGTVYLAHAWVPDKDRNHTVGPWHWWNVYQTYPSAKNQAIGTADAWKGYGLWEVFVIEGGSVGVVNYNSGQREDQLRK